MEERKILCNGREICYVLTYKDVKNINLRIKQNGEVAVSAKIGTPTARIEDFIVKKSTFILNALDKFAQYKNEVSESRQYISGESFRIIGRDVRLKLEKSNDNAVFFDGVYLRLQTKSPSDIRKKQILVDKFYKELCETTFLELVEQYYPKFKKYGVKFPQIKIRNMKTRWGSCMVNKATITLNSSLIGAPKNCIEYVVLHELCHFVHPNHSKDFYNLVATFMPDWKARKKELEKQVGLL